MDQIIKAKTFGTLHNDLFFNKNVSISFDCLNVDTNADYNVLVQIEPPSIINIVEEIIKNKNHFDLILTWNEHILSKCENSKLFPFGSCWINPEDRLIHYKNKNISIISSNKRKTTGHNLRHQLISDKLIDMAVFGRGYNPIENKITALKDYMFSVIIENEDTKNWFTEKIIDCLITGTVPIYWGCENIGDYFDTRGFIIFNDVEEFKTKINTFNETTYLNMLPYIKINYEKAKEYSDFWGRVELEIKKNLNL